MALLKTFTPRESRRVARGFTLIEMLVVIGIVVFIGSTVLFFDLSNYRGDAFRGEKNTMVTLLQKARADALNNIHQIPHGVAIFPADHPKSYVLFEGASYAASSVQTRAVVDASYTLTLVAGSPTEIVFAQLSGDVNFNGDIMLGDPQRNITTAITLNHEGAILY